MLPYGRLYCLEIDHALVRGFNPKLSMEVNKTLTIDGEPCEFVFHGASQGRANASAEINRRSASVAERTVQTWEYHCGHLYKTFNEVLVENFGRQGEIAVSRAMSAFADHLGEEAKLIVLSYLETDFDSLPD